jgi:hypothetical protein
MGSYCANTDVYLKTGLTSTEVLSATVDSLILDAEAELEELTRRKWTSGNAKTEVINAPNKDYIATSSGLTYGGNYATTINLSEYPIQSITNFDQIDINGSVTVNYALLTSVQIAAGTYATTDYWLDIMICPITQNIIPYGRITLKTDVFSGGRNSILVSYTYGYTSVPTVIKNLAVCLAGIRTWITFLGASYNFFESYSIPQQTVSKGALFERGQQMINSLTEEANRLLDRIGRKNRILFYASSDAR